VNRRITALTAATILMLGASAVARAQSTTGTTSSQTSSSQTTSSQAQQAGQAAAAAGRSAAATAREVARDVTRAVTREVDKAVNVEVARHIQAERDRAVVVQRSEFKFEQKDVKTQKLATGPTGDIALKNIVGDITVKAGGGSEATIEIIRISRGRTEADAKLGLEKVTVDVGVRGERATVETRYPDDRRPNYAVSVSYNVTAPAGTGVTIDTVSGDLVVAGLKGEVAVHAISGRIDLSNCSRVSSARATSADIALTNVQSSGDLEVEGISGDIKLTGIKARRLVTGIVSGTISATDVQAEGASLTTMSGDIAYSGTVAPKGRYEFRAHSGTVKLGLTGGFDLEARTFSGDVKADPSLGIAAPSSNSRSIRGTTGNGGASVVATTFSGSVWVGKKIG